MSDPAPKIIPFGKYKGQPLEVMAQDRQYVDWLLSQSWFIEKFQSLYTVVINNFQEPSETPEHNRMQTQFLNPYYLEKVCTEVLRRSDTEYNKFASVRAHSFNNPIFECAGFDVMVQIVLAIRTERDTEEWHSHIAICFELKPRVSDDFPAILRQIKIAGSNFGPEKICSLIVGNYSGKGAKWEDVVKIFATSRIVAILEADAIL